MLVQLVVVVVANLAATTLPTDRRRVNNIVVHWRLAPVLSTMSTVRLPGGTKTITHFLVPAPMKQCK
jgi:hypothetical protein